MQDAEPMEVFVLRHDQQSVISRVGPDGTIGRRGEADVANVDGTGIKVSERPDKACCEILVET